MTVITEPKFDRSMRELSAADQLRVKRAIDLLVESAGRYPGLRVKRVKQSRRLFEARISDKIRLFYSVVGGILTLHDYDATHDRMNSPSRRRRRRKE